MKAKPIVTLLAIFVITLVASQLAPPALPSWPATHALASTLDASSPAPIPITPVESDHPYKDNENKTWTLNNDSSFNAGRIHFSRIEIEDGVESIQILDMNNQLIQEITTSAPGGMWSDIVPGLAVKIVFKSDGSGQYWDKYWGFKVDQLDPMNYTSVTYSPHPYADNWDDTKTLINPTPTETATRVHFDRIELEAGVDYIIIRDINNVPYQWITGAYAGGFTSKAVPGPALRVQLVSDGSGRAWGYNAAAVLGTSAADPADFPPSSPTLAESDHNYASNTDRTWILTNPDLSAVSSKVHFSQIEIDNDGGPWGTALDYLYILDASDTVIQTLNGGLHDFWTDYVPGRVVKIRLVSDSGQNWWGFRADAIVNSVSHPGLAQSDHPYALNTDKTWLITNPDLSAVSSKVHFSQIEIDNDGGPWGTALDYLYILDAGDTVIQTLSGGLHDFWTDYVPGRVVKIRLVSDSGQNWWGFRADDIRSAPPTPILASIDPTSIAAGSPGFTLTVTGASFVPESVVRWDSTNLATAFVSDSRLTAAIPAALVATKGNVSIAIYSPGAPGTGQSNALQFAVLNPVSTLTSLSKTTAMVGNGTFTLELTGSNFVPSSVARWDGADLATTFVNGTQFRAVVPAGLLATAGTFNVTVFNPTPGGGSTAAQVFTVNNPMPTLNSVSPTTAVAHRSFTLTVNGTNFNHSSVIRWGGANLPTTYVSATRLTCEVPVDMLPGPGSVGVTVLNRCAGRWRNQFTNRCRQGQVVPAPDPESPIAETLRPEPAGCRGGCGRGWTTEPRSHLIHCPPRRHLR